MKVTIDININQAKSALVMTSGDPSIERHLQEMSDAQIAQEVVRHFKGWGVSLAEDDCTLVLTSQPVYEVQYDIYTDTWIEQYTGARYRHTDDGFVRLS